MALNPSKLRRKLMNEHLRLMKLRAAYFSLQERFARVNAMRRAYADERHDVLSRSPSLSAGWESLRKGNEQLWHLESVYYALTYTVVEGWHTLAECFGEVHPLIEKEIGVSQATQTELAATLQGFRHGVFHYRVKPDRRVESQRALVPIATMHMFVNRLTAYSSEIIERRLHEIAEELARVEVQLEVIPDPDAPDQV